ncbi:hypothetical protein SAMN06265355_12640 [Actinomadura mexicana]|uniref:Uncharacterized protein n=1 Tax=Actinomadura mexicana TaxID=134959 RepID=A0A239GUV1_9ACTN|nr:hypothetical protein SAMN06265355_12640 [Actinomadura mexicana]
MNSVRRGPSGRPNSAGDVRFGMDRSDWTRWYRRARKHAWLFEIVVKVITWVIITGIGR